MNLSHELRTMHCWLFIHQRCTVQSCLRSPLHNWKGWRCRQHRRLLDHDPYISMLWLEDVNCNCRHLQAICPWSVIEWGTTRRNLKGKCGVIFSIEFWRILVYTYTRGRMNLMTLLFFALMNVSPIVYSRTHKIHVRALQPPYNANAAQAARIPQIIHQNWKEHYNLQERQRMWRQTWIDQNPGWKVILWSDDDNKQLVRQHYSWLLDFYNSLNGVHRADMVKFCCKGQLAVISHI